MTDPKARPRPRPSEWSEGFWQGCARGELVIQRCDDELEEGVRMVADLEGVAPEQVRIGMPVQVFFERVDDALALPRFRPGQDGR